LNLRKLQQEANANQESAVTYPAREPTKQEKHLLDKGADYGTVDTRGMVPVDLWNKYFGEIGEIEQSGRNYHTRWRRWTDKRRDANRKRIRELNR